MTRTLSCLICMTSTKNNKGRFILELVQLAGALELPTRSFSLRSGQRANRLLSYQTSDYPGIHRSGDLDGDPKCQDVTNYSLNLLSANERHRCIDEPVTLLPDSPNPRLSVYANVPVQSCLTPCRSV